MYAPKAKQHDGVVIHTRNVPFAGQRDLEQVSAERTASRQNAETMARAIRRMRRGCGSGA